MAAIHLGIVGVTPGCGRPCHCLTARNRNSTPSRSLITSTDVDAPGVGVVGAAGDEQHDDADDDQPDDPTGGEGRAVRPCPRRAQHQDHGDDGQRAQGHADGRREDVTDRLAHEHPFSVERRPGRGDRNRQASASRRPSPSPSSRHAPSCVPSDDGTRCRPASTAPARVPIAGRLRPLVVARRPHRRAHGVGRARARGAGLRVDRRGLAGRRSLRRPARAAPVRRLRQLPPPRRRPDVGDRRALRGRRRRPHHWRPDDVLAFTSVLAIVTGAARPRRRVLRLGFLANFISEPVLKGFIIGLALTIIIGQVPKLFGIEKADGDFFEQLWGVLANLGDTQARTLVVGLMSLVVVLGLAPLRRRSCRRRSSPSIVGVVAVDAVRPRRQGRRDRRPDRQWPAVASGCRRVGASATT